jgi:guanine deaminase
MSLSEPSSLHTSVANDDPEEPFRWVIHGNVVIPTGNPFSSSIPPPCEEEPDVEWLGPGLKLCKKHVVAVDHDGVIVLICHESVLDLEGYTRKRAYVKLGPLEFLSPGFIDLHIHAPQFAFTGTATDRPLMGQDGWLETYTFPAEQSLQDDLPKARRVYKGVVRKTLSSGTTTACYFATLDLEPCKVLVDVALNLGQRALVGKVCMDRHSPENYVQSTQQNIDETRELIEYIHKRAGKLGERPVLPLLLPIITPRFIPTCTPELLSALGKLATEHECHIQSHISESADEVEFTQYLEGSDRTDADIFDSHSLLSDRCIMAHGVYLSEPDLDLMRKRGSAVAHCPLSNFFFGGTTLPCRKLMERDNKVGLGTDVAGGYSPCMLNSARMAVVASHAHQQKSIGENNAVLDYRHAFYLATLAGAEALGVSDKIGTFKLGMELDALILQVSSNVDILETDTTADVFQKILNLGDDRNVKRVFVQGREVMSGGSILSVI